MLKDIPQGPKRQGVPTGIHARRCTSPLATSQFLSAVPVVLPVSHPLTADCLGLGQRHRHQARLRQQERCLPGFPVDAGQRPSTGQLGRTLAGLLERSGTEEVEIYRYAMAAAQGHGCADNRILSYGHQLACAVHPPRRYRKDSNRSFLRRRD
jgi:hypothetical protein